MTNREETAGPARTGRSRMATTIGLLLLAAGAFGLSGCYYYDDLYGYDTGYRYPYYNSYPRYYGHTYGRAYHHRPYYARTLHKPRGHGYPPHQAHHGGHVSKPAPAPARAPAPTHIPSRPGAVRPPSAMGRSSGHSYSAPAPAPAPAPARAPAPSFVPSRPGAVRPPSAMGRSSGF